MIICRKFLISYASELLLSIFDRIYVINLTQREDRRREMDAELNRIGLGLYHPAITLFPASLPKDKGRFSSRGARGCFESHLAVHRTILDDGVGRALVLEDDASFVSDFTALLTAIDADLQALDWDLLYSVTPLQDEPGDEVVGDSLLRLSPEHTFIMAHFVGFSHRLSTLAVPYLEAMYSREPGDPSGGAMHVDGAYCWLRQAYPELLVLGSRSPLAVQRPSRSDIADLRIWDRVPVVAPLVTRLRRSRPVMSVLKKLRAR